MKRTSLMLPESLQRDLRRVAAERGVSVADLLREGAEMVVRTRRPKPRLGIDDSGRSDIGQRAGEIDYEPESWR